MPVYEQSVRNCPWVVEFWVSYARAMERNSVDTEGVHGKMYMYVYVGKIFIPWKFLSPVTNCIELATFTTLVKIYYTEKNFAI